MARRLVCEAKDFAISSNRRPSIATPSFGDESPGD
jgi:hypothetical protein